MKLPVPVNIITGSLGSGKTTAICHLIKTKPEGERWAVLVNEFGALGIDGAVIASARSASQAAGSPGSSSVDIPGVVVRELAGGCMCCALSGPLTAAVATLVRCHTQHIDLTKLQTSHKLYMQHQQCYKW